MTSQNTYPDVHPGPHPGPRSALAWNPQRPSSMPSHKYRSVFDRVEVPRSAEGRAWPDARFSVAPLWVPVDLRDGNQALAEPMDTDRKRRMFELFVAMGFKEIEVGYPSAGQTDFDFVRYLAAAELPDDLTVSVFTPAIPRLIERTFEAVEGMSNILVHLYTATAPVWRDVVLGRDRGAVHQLVRDAAEQLARLSDARAAGPVRFEYSPEVFNLTEPDFILQICNGLTEFWDASPNRPVVHNLPATVEIATPNVYADQIEYFHRQLVRRDSAILSVHPHNDRGTGVACAELAVLAGAQRVEGCLFGNGERTGNVDLVTLALNLHAQGVDPMIDFSDIDEVRRVVEHCNRIPVHPRHPYAGEFVYTAFSGTHQDAIKKGFEHHATRTDGLWDVPYLPIDPVDVGRGYEAVIRVNSQSGKGGIAYVLRADHGLELPRGIQPEFARAVQRVTDAGGAEASSKDLWDLFRQTYVDPCDAGPLVLGDWCEAGDPLAVLVKNLARAGIWVDIVHYSEQRGLAPRADSAADCVADRAAVAYAECRVDGAPWWGRRDGFVSAEGFTAGCAGRGQPGSAAGGLAARSCSGRGSADTGPHNRHHAASDVIGGRSSTDTSWLRGAKPASSRWNCVISVFGSTASCPATILPSRCSRSQATCMISLAIRPRPASSWWWCSRTPTSTWAIPFSPTSARVSISIAVSTPYPVGNGSRSSRARRAAYSPPSGCTNPASSGQCRFRIGRATSSVTRPPPAGSIAAPATSGRSYIAFTRCTVGSHSSGPSTPVTTFDENSRRSASMKQTRSPVVTAKDRHRTSPLPGTDGISGRISSRWRTFAPAAAAVSAVRSVEPESTTNSSSTRGDDSIRSRRMASTIAPTVSCSFSAGSTTVTLAPVAAFAVSRRSRGQSAAAEERSVSHRSTSSSTVRLPLVLGGLCRVNGRGLSGRCAGGLPKPR